MQKNNKHLNIIEKGGIFVSFIILSILLVAFAIAKSPYFLSLIKENNAYVKKAMYWERKDLGVLCELCPNNCFLGEGQRGLCKVRINKSNTLYTEVYNQPITINIDPIEKKTDIPHASRKWDSLFIYSGMSSDMQFLPELEPISVISRAGEK